MTNERRNSGVPGDGRRRVPSRASSTSAQPARRGSNRKLVKSTPWGTRMIAAVGGLGRGILSTAKAGAKKARRTAQKRPASAPRASTPPRRVERSFGGWRWAAVAGGAVAVAFGLQLGWRAVTTSPVFALEDVEVVGAARATADEIRALASVEPGDNSVALDTAELARLVEKHPWVSSARVLRRLPRGLTIEVEEHAPVALVALEHLYYVDADGEVVKRLVPGEREALPVITGLSREDVEHSDALALSQIRAALAFVGAWSRSEAAARGGTLDEVHVGPAGEISIGLADEPVRAHLGPGPWDESLARYLSVREEARERGFVAAEIAAWSERHPERAVVRIAALEAPVTGAARVDATAGGLAPDEMFSVPAGNGTTKTPAKPKGRAGAR